jgi:cysteine desulfurase
MDPIYLDHAATTPVRPEVTEAMAPYLAEVFGNPSSQHRWGRKAATALEDARTRVGTALGVDRQEVYFVRGGTEADNLAVFGRAQFARRKGRPPVIAVSAIEHVAVLTAAETATTPDGDLHVLPVSPHAVIDEERLQVALDAKPDLLSLMWVNNEVGLELAVPQIAARAAELGVCVHTDAVQALGKVPVDLASPGIQLATLTGHKIYGPKSTGMLYKRRGTDLDPRIVGGGQERALRPGTQDVAGAVGFATAVELVVAEQGDESVRLSRLKDRLLADLRAALPDLRVHGAPSACGPHILNVGILGVDAEAFLIELDICGVAVSAGSACGSGAHAGSHVLAALYGDELEGSALRFSLGRLNTDENSAEAARRVIDVVKRVRAYSEPASVFHEVPEPAPGSRP